MTSNLIHKLSKEIVKKGPISVERYMELCLNDHESGYYMTRDPFGRSGDFTTAPEISQMFGELLGAWMCATWKIMGKPNPIMLIELGPGRGTLMVDALRSVSKIENFLLSARIHLVETSPVLKNIQARNIYNLNSSLNPEWWDHVSEVPNGPTLLIANEFFDSLPINQYVMTKLGWRERLVSIQEKRLKFVTSKNIPKSFELPEKMPKPKYNDIFETSPAALNNIKVISKRFSCNLGASLLIDYARTKNKYGSTLQAVKSHRHVDLLKNPGESDLTAHVDFEVYAKKANDWGAATHGPIPQGTFLNRLGISLRMKKLLEHASPSQALDIRMAEKRLTSDDSMGQLFQVLSISSPTLHLPDFMCDA